MAVNETRREESDSLLLLPTSSENPQQSESDDTFPSFFHLIRHGVVLQNSGSTARDHLANEQTYLAWIRIALAFTGVGIGLLKWKSVPDTAGYCVLAGGFFALINSTLRYLQVMRDLSRAQFEPNVRSLLAMMVVMLALIVALLVLAL